MSGLPTTASASLEAHAASGPGRAMVHGAGRVLAAGGALGIIGQFLFHGAALGVNYPIAMGLLLVGGWLLRARRARPSVGDAWLGPAAVVFASFVSVRADPTIVVLDVGASLALAGGALASFGGRSVVARPLTRLFALAAAELAWLFAGAAAVLADSRGQLPSPGRVQRRLAPALPVLRGLLIAIPIVIVFVALFSAADAVFARLVEDIADIEVNLGDLPGRLLLGMALAWLAAGAIGLAASRAAAHRDAPEQRSRGWIGGVEAVTVLIAVDIVFVAFVALQAAYLFGGLDTLSAVGMTYADYARRGFFELVAVAILAGGLVVALERGARARTASIVGAGIGLAILTGAVLASAVLRLRLYQDAYGWTELRLYVLATIILVALGLVGLIAALATDRVRWIGHLLLGASLVIGLALNLIGPARFITEQNVARVLNPELVPPNGSHGLDTWYVVSLGDDAIPDLVRALPALPTEQADALRRELETRRADLRASEELTAWPAWNLGRAAAREALDLAVSRGELDPRSTP